MAYLEHRNCRFVSFLSSGLAVQIFYYLFYRTELYKIYFDPSVRERINELFCSYILKEYFNHLHSLNYNFSHLCEWNNILCSFSYAPICNFYTFNRFNRWHFNILVFMLLIHLVQMCRNTKRDLIRLFRVLLWSQIKFIEVLVLIYGTVMKKISFEEFRLFCVFEILSFLFVVFCYYYLTLSYGLILSSIHFTFVSNVFFTVVEG